MNRSGMEGMPLLTAEEMRRIDRLTVDAGIPEVVLMENAAHRVVEAMELEYTPLGAHRIVVLCGKGNNGGDGLAIARLLWTRFRPAALDVVLAEEPPHAQLALLHATGFRSTHREIQAGHRFATVVVDALLGTGLSDPVREPFGKLIASIPSQFPFAKVVAVDVPSGMESDTGETKGPVVRADITVTFTAPKYCHALGSGLGKVTVGQIGSDPALMNEIKACVNGPSLWRGLIAGREPQGHKGTYGHVAVIGGAAGKTGSVAMTGLAALRMGAGLVTVAHAGVSLPTPELMTMPLDTDWQGLVKDAVALGPGLGMDERVAPFAAKCEAPMVIDADGLNSLVDRMPSSFPGPRVFTPHPGEMARLQRHAVEDRVADARRLARDTGAIVVLKGHRTVIAQADGRIAINITGSPGMGTAGTGDILTGLIATLLAQSKDPWPAVLAAVHLHGLAGQLAAEEMTEQSMIATDILRHLPEAIRRCA